MSSFVYVEFDRTPPKIEIYAPPYTTRDLINEIVIDSNENLSSYQEIYMIDSNGDRHDYTFDKTENNQVTGLVKFSNVPVGIVTIYARLKDEVGNVSNRVSKTINVKESLTLLSLKSNQSVRVIGNGEINNSKCRDLIAIQKEPTKLEIKKEISNHVIKEIVKAIILSDEDMEQRGD